MNLTFQIDDPYIPHVETELLSRAIELTLTEQQQPENVTLTVVITTSEAVQTLNAQYLGFDKPTDILSFGNEPDDFAMPDDEDDEPYLGDLIIAYPVAEQQAQAAGHATMAELALLAIHGTLHLLGFDHDTPSNKEVMWEKQRLILTMLNLSNIQPTENETSSVL